MTSKATFNRGALDPLGPHRSRGDDNSKASDEPPMSFQRRPNPTTESNSMSFQRRPNPTNESNYNNSTQRGGGDGARGDDNWRRPGSSSTWDKGTDRFRSGPSSFERGGSGDGNRETRSIPTNDTSDRSSNISRNSSRTSEAASERPRLTLIKRTTEDSTGKAATQREETTEPVISSDKTADEHIDTIHDPDGRKEENQDIMNESQGDDGTGKMTQRHDRTRRELKVTNSRAAFLGEASGSSRDLPREDNMTRREKQPDRDYNYTSRQPPILNERFAKLAVEERDKHDREREDRRFSGERGPPPVQQSSRFSKAVEADDTYIPPSARGAGIGQAPAMVQNSRFAAASAEFQTERQAEMRTREDRRSAREHQSVGPPPVPSNTRFAAAFAELEADREREGHERDDRRSTNRNRDPADRFNAPSGYDGQQQGRFRQDRGGRPDDNRGGRYGKVAEVDPFPSLGPLISKKTEFIRPEMPKHLQQKKEPEHVLPPVSAPLALPGEDEEAARARIEKKKREAEEKALAEKKLAEELAAKKAAEQALAAEKVAKAAAVADELLSKFASGEIMGSDLAAWCKQQGSLLPSVDRLLFHMLQEREKKNPDPACPWAEKDKYGAALSTLVQDDIEGQVGILWGIQKYCDKQGFPKIGGEYLVQAMFRAMYKYDLVDGEGFSEWKEDDSEEHEAGKVKCVVQTIDWFNWLQEDEEDEDEDYEEEDD